MHRADSIWVCVTNEATPIVINMLVNNLCRYFSLESLWRTIEYFAFSSLNVSFIVFMTCLASKNYRYFMIAKSTIPVHLYVLIMGQLEFNSIINVKCN